MNEISPEALLDFVLNDVLRERPQIVDGELRYIFCGSLGTMLYNMADTMRRGDANQLPAISVGEPISISGVRTFLRQIGDVDIARTKAGSNVEELRKNAHIEDSTGIVTRNGETHIDPANSFTCPYSELLLKTKESKSVYVASPEEIVGHKVAHFITFADDNRADYKTFNDLESIVTGMVPAIPDFNLTRVRNIAFKEHYGWMPLPYQRVEFSGYVRKFIEDLIQSHPDAVYLQDRKFEQHLDICILLALERFSEEKTKRAILDFFNSKKDTIIQFEPHPNDSCNTEIAVEYFLEKGIENVPFMAKQVKMIREREWDEDRKASLPIVVKKIVKENPWIYYQSTAEWTAFDQRSDIVFPGQKVVRVPYFRVFRCIDEKDVPIAIDLLKLAKDKTAEYRVIDLLDYTSQIEQTQRQQLLEQATQLIQNDKSLNNLVYQAMDLSNKKILISK